MTIKFPTFEPGTPGTLLDSENAKKVKAFIEAWNSATVVIGSENKVSISDSNVVISLNSADLGGGGSDYTEGAAADVVGSDGKLNKVVKHSTWATPTTYPTLLATNGGTAQMTSSAFVAAIGNYAVSLRAEAGEGLYIQKSGGATYLFVQESAITHTMTVREVDVCDGGVPKKMLILASAPY